MCHMLVSGSPAENERAKDQQKFTKHCFPTRCSQNVELCVETRNFEKEKQEKLSLSFSGVAINMEKISGTICVRLALAIAVFCYKLDLHPFHWIVVRTGRVKVWFDLQSWGRCTSMTAEEQIRLFGRSAIKIKRPFLSSVENQVLSIWCKGWNHKRIEERANY
jgi:hypothetical protein